jgi:hypothetical protein
VSSVRSPLGEHRRIFIRWFLGSVDDDGGESDVPPAGDHQMNALRRSICLLFVLFAVTSVAGIAGAASLPVVSADVNSDATFQQNTTNTSTNTTNASTNTTKTSTNASITFVNQTRSGRSVYITSATLPEGGFVVLKEPGPNGTVVGVSLPLNPGTHQGKITLRGVPGTDLNQSRLGANTTLVATLHRDSDGDDRFDGLLAAGTDDAYTENGTPVSDRARITIPAEERATTAAVMLTNQTSNGTTVTIASMTLPAGGYVGIHRGDNGSNATAGMVGATGYLEPGIYENVTVRVGAGVPGRNASALTDSGRVSAVVYEDTDSDRRFQYVPSGGVEDDPFLVNSTPVAASAFITVQRPQTPTQTPTQTQTTETSTQTPTAEPPATNDHDKSTPYGGVSNDRDNIFKGPLFPLLMLVFVVFAVLTIVGR